MNNAPKDILCCICKHLSVRDIKNIRLVSKRLHKYTSIYLYKKCVVNYCRSYGDINEQYTCSRIIATNTSSINVHDINQYINLKKIIVDCYYNPMTYSAIFHNIVSLVYKYSCNIKNIKQFVNLEKLSINAFTCPNNMCIFPKIKKLSIGFKTSQSFNELSIIFPNVVHLVVNSYISNFDEKLVNIKKSFKCIKKVTYFDQQFFC